MTEKLKYDWHNADNAPDPHCAVFVTDDEGLEDMRIADFYFDDEGRWDPEDLAIELADKLNKSAQ